MPRAKASPQVRAARQAYATVPRKTKADDPGRYTKVPHEFGDLLIAGGKLGGAVQRDLIYWIERYTWGDPKRPEYAKLSITKLAQLCQVWDDDRDRLRPIERKTVAVALADLERRGIIAARDRKGCGPTTAKMYKLTPERWKKAAPYVPPTPRQIEAAEADLETEDAAIARDQILSGVTPDEIETALQTVRPGKESRPQPVSFRPGKDADPVTVRLVYTSRFDFPVNFRARTGAGGRILVTASPYEGETKANDCSRGQLQCKKSPVDNTRFIEFETVCNTLAMEIWGFALDDDLTRRMFQDMGATPIETFERIARHKRMSRKDKPGLMLHLVWQAARSYAAQSRLPARQRDGATAAGTGRQLSSDEQAAIDARVMASLDSEADREEFRQMIARDARERKSSTR